MASGCLRFYFGDYSIVKMETKLTIFQPKPYSNDLYEPIRKKRSAMSYEIQIIFGDRTERDVMTHLGKGAARDCYQLEHNRMVLKWFHEVEEPKYKTLHSDDYSGSGTILTRTTLATLKSSPHSNTNNATNPNPNPKPKPSPLQMIQRFMESGIKWESDFHAGNICYCECSGVWKLVDLEKLETATAKAESAINTGARQTAITSRVLLVPIVFGPFLESEKKQRIQVICNGLVMDPNPANYSIVFHIL